MNTGYICIFLLLHLESESIGGAVEAQIVAAGEHEDIFGEAAALRARLWIHEVILFIFFYYVRNFYCNSASDKVFLAILRDKHSGTILRKIFRFIYDYARLL